MSGAAATGTPAAAATVRRQAAGVLAVAAIALATPCLARWQLQRRLHADVEPALSAALGVPVHIGDIDTSLTGAIRLRDVAAGGTLEADAVEAGVGLRTLLAGRFDADEIRVDRPRLRLRVDADGRLDLATLVDRARAARARSGRGGGVQAAGPGRDRGASRLRRIRVTGGELVVLLGPYGRVELRGVDLLPRASGVRVVAAGADVDLAVGPWAVRGQVGRTALDVRLPGARVERLVALDGALELSAGDGPALALAGVALTRGVDAPGAVRLEGRVVERTVDADGGTLALTLRRDGVGRRLTVTAARLPLAPFAAVAPASLRLDGARATGTISALLDRRAGSTRVDATIDLALTDLIVADDRLADEPVPWSGHLSAHASAEREPGATRVAVDDLRVLTDDIPIEGALELTFLAGDAVPARADVRVRVPEVSCMGALAALPAPLRDGLDGLEAHGTMQAEVRLRYAADHPDDLSLAADVDMTRCKVTREASAGDPTRLRAPFEHGFPDGSRALIGPGQPGWVRLDQLPSHVAAAFVAAEDARFFSHPGFDVHQLERSLAVDVAEGRFSRGGSTISQQLVKNVFLGPERTLARKLQEAVLTWRLEARLDKRTILETYLNVIELGEGVFGVGAAARFWFDEEPRRLSRWEAAFLAALTPAPRPTARRVLALGGPAGRKLDPDTAHRVELVLRKMGN